MTDLFVNEKFIGEVENPTDFVNRTKIERRKNKSLSGFNIMYDEKCDEIKIYTSKGRALRPLIIVENGKSKLTRDHIKKIKEDEIGWKDLEEQSVIEYLDAGEEENAYVALSEEELNEEHTHLEISPMNIFGLCTSLVPYANYDSSSRLNRGSKTQKQSLGLYAANYLLRMDTDVSILHYPQIPIIKTAMHDFSNYDKHPSGQNIVIAVMSYEGYNMQDAVIINKGSVDRGLFRSTYFRPYVVEELRYSGGLVDEICIPNKDAKGYRSENEYKHLEPDGIVYLGASVKEEDVIIGKISPPRFLGELEEFSIAASIKRESSTAIRHGEKGIIDMIVITENEEGNKLIQVRLRDQRIPEIGDKFASRYGQKGVIGAVIRQDDMPFSASGITPDLIFSPHSLPKRMTVSHLIEILGGKVGSLAGKYIDGTTFDVEPEKKLRKELLELGFREDGTETFYNGLTGEQLKAKIFVGNIYYLKLKHMVANKLHTRASGRIQLLTRQPIEGRSKGGGLRLGEMEKDCFVAHGASLLLKERFDSDKTIVHVCENCGLLAIYDKFRSIEYCTKCGNNTTITPIEISYAFKLLLDELKALGMYPRLKLKSKY
ncbi:DNA-directed RNA polymerase subunit B [archaeon]|nr:DNA-directed RNA polymerase subunit B [archaeon]